jgi:SAM-dependent methyltransferase
VLTISKRDKAWAIRSYPCTGLGVWLVPFISRSPAYATVLKRLGAGDTFLDVGCFLGGDMRRLAFDGAPTANLHGVDIVSHWDVGYELYRDRDRFNARFIEADILSTENPALQALSGRIDILSISAVLHQWNWNDQVEATKKIIAFTKPGAIVLGYQIGNVEAKEVVNGVLHLKLWRHDPASFAKMWDQAGAETGTTWETEARLRSWEDMGWDPADQAWMEPGDRVIDFVITRKSC